MSSYQSRVSERRNLVAQDALRPLENRLAYVEPLYGELYQEFVTLEGEHSELLVRSENSEAQLRTAQRKIRSTEKALADVTDRTQYSTAALVAKRRDVLLELEQLEERSKALEGDLEREQAQKTEAVAMANELRSELADREKELKALRAAHDKVQKDQEAGRRELEARVEDLQHDLEAEKKAAKERLDWATEKEKTSKATKKEISELKTALAKETKEREKAEKGAARLETVETELREALTMETKTREKVEQDLARLREDAVIKTEKEATFKSTKRELAALRDDLAREARAREKAEREFATYKADHDTRVQTLKKQVETLRAKAKQAQADIIAARTTTTKVPLETSRKRPASAVTMDSFESAKKPRREKATTAISEISLTPFLQRNAAADVSAIAAGNGTGAEHPGDISIVPVPAGTTSRILLAGANRKKYVPKAIVEPKAEQESPPSPPPPPPPPVRDATPPGPATRGDEDDVGEDSMLSLVKPPISKPAKPKPKPKARSRAKAAPPQPNPKPLEAEDPALARLPEKQQPPVRRRRKHMGEGINPTRFDDDGTGRISINLDADSRASEGEGRRASVISGLGAFKREISPPKKRPAALGGLFTKKS